MNHKDLIESERKRETIRKFLLDLVGVEKVSVYIENGSYVVYMIVMDREVFTPKDYINACYFSLGLHLTPKSVFFLDKNQSGKV